MDEQLGIREETLEDSAQTHLDEELEKPDPVADAYGSDADEVVEKEGSEADAEVDRVVEARPARCLPRHLWNRTRA